LKKLADARRFVVKGVKQSGPDVHVVLRRA